MGFPADGVAAVGDVTDYVPCDEVPKLLSRTAQRDLQETLHGPLQAPKIQRELLQKIYQALRGPDACREARRRAAGVP